MKPNPQRKHREHRPIDFADLKAIIRNNPAPAAPEAGSYKPACVFLLLYNPENPHILAIQKADSEGYPWSNHVALPGGHLDAEDASPLEGALRGVDPALEGRVLPAEVRRRRRTAPRALVDRAAGSSDGVASDLRPSLGPGARAGFALLPRDPLMVDPALGPLGT